jgi:AsmA-like C-terminal region
MPATLEQPKIVQPRSPERPSAWRWCLLAALLLGVILVGGAVFFNRDWPFTPKNVVSELEQATDSKVTFGAFHRNFLPHPGCYLESVTLTRGDKPGEQEVMKIRQLTINGKWTGLIQKHVAVIRADGVEATFPPIGTGPGWTPPDTDVIVDKLIANGAELQFIRHNPKEKPLLFSIRKFTAHHLVSQEPIKFEVNLVNPQPPGDIEASGTFGPWNKKVVSETPVKGNYTFRNADLSSFGGIAGILTSDGVFDGNLDSIDIKGRTSTPDFSTTDTPHKLDLSSEFHAEVDATNGDVKLDRVQAKLVKTLILTKGSVESHKEQDGKVASLNFAVRDGRIQDLLLMFVSDKQSPLNGTISLRAQTLVPPGKAPFLKRVQMNGDFGIESARFTKDETQTSINKLSTAGQGQGNQTDNPDRVLTDLEGHVVVKDGVATFTGLRFRVPGARARLNGTFDLITQKVDLRGMLYMDAKLPEATSGIKSFLLKAIDPFLKKNRHGGAKVPVSITGTYRNPSYHADPI